MSKYTFESSSGFVEFYEEETKTNHILSGKAVVDKLNYLEAKLAESEKVIAEETNKRWKLEEQLADSETHKNSIIQDKSVADKVIAEYEEEVKHIKQQLTEKEKELAKVEKERDGHYENYSLCWKDNEQLKQQLAEKEKDLVIKNRSIEVFAIKCEKQDQENEQLKQQLAEKEKEIEELKRFDDLNKTFFDLFRTASKEPDEVDNLFSFLKTMQEKQNQDKISFCIEKLEKVKDCIKKVPITDYEPNEHFEKMYKSDAIRQIDNQIKELKGVK